MRHISFILLALLPFFSLAQQPGFKKLYIGETTRSAFIDIAWDGEKLITTGQFLTDTAPNNALNGLLYMELDTNGNTLFTDIYFHPDDAVGSNIGNNLSVFDGRVYAPTQLYAQGQEDLLVTYNQSERVAEKLFHVPGLRTRLYHAVDYNNSILLSGDNQNFSYDIEGLLIKTDSAGSEQWRKYYGSNGFKLGIEEPYVVDENTIVLPGYRNYWPDDNLVLTWWTRTRILTVDSTGIIKSLWESPKYKENGVATRLLKDADGNWLYLTSEFVLKPGPIDEWGTRPKIVCRDSAFNLLWERYLPSFPSTINQLFDTKSTPDGNFVAVGQLTDTEWSGASIIHKFAPNGDSIWTFRDITVGYQNMGGVVVLPSGSVFAAGYLQDFDADLIYGFLIKLDKNGCIDTLCSGRSINVEFSAAHETEKVSRIRVFPNPASDVVTISNPIGEQIDILDLQGKIVRSVPVAGYNQTILIADLPAGAYIVRMQGKKLRVSYKIVKK